MRASPSTSWAWSRSSAAIVPVLIALTLAETSSWVDPAVLGWFAVGVVFLLAFIVVEAKAKDPMIPLDLFRNRTFAVSAVATFFAVFGFSILIIFLPLWFQIVKGESTTASGYLLFPFLIGLIFSSIAAGQIVSRTGRYKVAPRGRLMVSWASAWAVLLPARRHPTAGSDVCGC
jgi:Na+/melibiose symporter-like transporter